ncbi:MAG: PcfJ domain-containing protein [Bacteroides sp.]|nr:PcfJ domain-containing protein [Bacteroides sp.]
MKPKTKIQKEVVELSNQLPTMTSAQKEWAFRHCFKHFAIRRGNGTNTCSECGHSWKSTHILADAVCGCNCPHCGMKLEIMPSRKFVFQDEGYMGIVKVFKGWQVIRYFLLNSLVRKGEKVKYDATEVVQRWMNPQGKSVVIARLRTMNYWRDGWIFGSPMEVRARDKFYDFTRTPIYPKWSVLPEIKRNGFKGQLHELSPYELFSAILTDSKAETLLKANQIPLLRHLIRQGYGSLDTDWASVRICIRNGYIIPDGSIWCDYIEMLRRKGKDIRSPKYICPIDLNREHDRRRNELRRQREKEEKAKKRQKAMEDEKRFHELKSKFFGISFTDGIIQVRVLDSVHEYLEEGISMHHCVFNNAYYLKEDSLILSATIEGKRIETIEVNLNTLKVVQSRGVCNENTEYHDQIVNLVNANRKLIRQRMKTTA